MPLLSEPDLWSSLLWTKAYTDTQRERECDLDDSSKFGQECQQPQDILVSRQFAHKFTSANYTAAIRSQKPIRKPDPYLNHDCQNCFIHPMPKELYTGQVWVPVPKSVPILCVFTEEHVVLGQKWLSTSSINLLSRWSPRNSDWQNKIRLILLKISKALNTGSDVIFSWHTFYFCHTAKLLTLFSLPIKNDFFSINHVWTDCYDFYLPYFKQLLPVTSKSVCSDINILIWLFMSKYILTVSYNVKAIGRYAFFDESWRCEATWDIATVGRLAVNDTNCIYDINWCF